MLMVVIMYSPLGLMPDPPKLTAEEHAAVEATKIENRVMSQLLLYKIMSCENTLANVGLTALQLCMKDYDAMEYYFKYLTWKFGK